MAQNEYYNSPGVAASDAVQQLLMDRANLAHQGVQDRLALMREQDLRQEHEESLQVTRDKHAADLAEKERGDTVKDVANMQLGDIPDAGLVARAKKYQVPLPVVPAQPTTTGMAGGAPVPESMPGVAAVPQGQVQQGIAPTRTGVVPRPEAGPAGGAFRFAGSSKQQAEKSFVDALPADSPERRAAEYEIATGHPIPAGSIKPPAAETVAEMRQNPHGDGPPERLVDGQWVSWKGDVPKGAHWQTEAAPKAPSQAGWSFHTMTRKNAKGEDEPFMVRGNAITGAVDPVTLPTGVTSPVAPPHAKLAADINKLNPAQQAVFKKAITEQTTGLSHLFMSEDDKLSAYQAAYDEAKKVGAGPTGGPADAATIQSLLGKLKNRGN